MFSHNPYITKNFLPLLTESCANNYCQDGLHIYPVPANEIEQFPSISGIYGHYVLQSNNINERPHFEMSSYTTGWARSQVPLFSHKKLGILIFKKFGSVVIWASYNKIYV